MESTENTGIVEPTKIVKPTVSQEEARIMVKRIYGLNVVATEELVSYYDRNFYVEFDGVSENPHLLTAPGACVFKVINTWDSQDTGVVEAQTNLMLYLKDKGFTISYPIINKEGEYTSEQTRTTVDDDGNVKSNMHIIRMLKFIPGKTLNNVPYKPDLLFGCGRYIAELDNALENFYHPALATRSFVWQLTKIPQLTRYTHAIQDEGKRRMCEKVIQNFVDEVETMYGSLRKGTIHGDFNEHNIIVVPSTSLPEDYEVSGVIDMGDIHFSCIVFEVSMAILHTMLDSEVVDQLEAGGHTLAGYLSKRMLTDQEYKVFKACVEGRLVQILVMGAYTYSKDPSNTYVLFAEKNGWILLERLTSMSEQQLFSILDRVIKSRGLCIQNFPYSS